MVRRVGRQNYVGQLLDCLGLREPAREGGREEGLEGEGVRDRGGGRLEHSVGAEGGWVRWLWGFSMAVGGDSRQRELL